MKCKFHFGKKSSSLTYLALIISRNSNQFKSFVLDFDFF